MSTHQQSRAAVAVTSLLLAACGPTIHSARDEAILIPQGATWAWGPNEAATRPDSSRPNHVRAPRLAAAVAGDEIVLQRFQRSVAAAMQTKGFRQVDSAANTDFLLTVGFRAMGNQGPRVGTMIGADVGFGGGFIGGYGGGIVSVAVGRGRRGGYFGRPVGFRSVYVPWGMGYYDPFYWGVAPMMYNAPWPASYRQPALVAMLRQRSTGNLAWRGQVSTDGYAVNHLTQDKMNELVAKLFSKLP